LLIGGPYSDRAVSDVLAADGRKNPILQAFWSGLVGATHPIAIVGRAVQCFGASLLRRLARKKARERKTPVQRRQHCHPKVGPYFLFALIPLQGPPGLALQPFVWQHWRLRWLPNRYLPK
jgi:hypothetical protein